MVLMTFAFMVFGAQAAMADEGTLDNGLVWEFDFNGGDADYWLSWACK